LHQFITFGEFSLCIKKLTKSLQRLNALYHTIRNLSQSCHMEHVWMCPTL